MEVLNLPATATEEEMKKSDNPLVQKLAPYAGFLVAAITPMKGDDLIMVKKLMQRISKSQGKTQAKAIAIGNDLMTGAINEKDAVAKIDGLADTFFREELDKTFSEFQKLPRKSIIENPFSLVETPYKITPEVLELMGTKNGRVIFTRRSLKHLADKGTEGKAILDQLPDILKNPDELRQGVLENRFIISKSIKNSKGGRPYAISMEIIEKDGNLIVTAFPTDTKYLDGFDLLWRTGEPRGSVSPSAYPKRDAGSRPEFSALKEDQNLDTSILPKGKDVNKDTSGHISAKTAIGVGTTAVGASILAPLISEVIKDISTVDDKEAEQFIQKSENLEELQKLLDVVEKSDDEIKRQKFGKIIVGRMQELKNERAIPD